MLLAMAVYDTEENNRSWMTRATLWSLSQTVNWDRHRLFIVDNGSCLQTQRYIREASAFLPLTLLQQNENLGTARAINLAWQFREPGEHAVKMDNDVVIRQIGWADWIEDVFTRAPGVGICALKRKDLAESPWAAGDMKSRLWMVPHLAGERWLVVEEVRGVMGTVQGFSSALLDKIGYLTQPSIYGFDDSLASLRSRLAGYKNVFLHGFEIDHIDRGGDAYCQWKRDEAARQFPAFNALVLQYEAGILPLYYDGGLGG